MRTNSTARSAFFNASLLIAFAFCSAGVFPVVAGGNQSASGTIASQAGAQTPGTWEPTGSIATARSSHTATLLPNGQVLVGGGYDVTGYPSTTAELYDPATGLWSVTGSMTTKRARHTATLLPNGQVLVSGGSHPTTLASAELYDPATGLWTETGSMATERYSHTATLLLNGQVLVAGGGGEGYPPLIAEIYDPATGLWTTTGSMTTEHVDHTATLLPNGKVLVAGISGSGLNRGRDAELYDPASGLWTATGSMAKKRWDHTATLLLNDKVLVAGGGPDAASAELYDPATGLWSNTGSMAVTRDSYTATLLPNGQVLAAGGNGSSAELYDPASGIWTATGSMTTARRSHTATLLSNGQVLVAAGYAEQLLATAELYTADGGGLMLVSAASRLTHGTVGTFDVNMPLSGISGVECRSATTYNAVFTFDAPVTSGQVTVLSGAATVGAITFSGNSMTAQLTGVTSAEIVILHTQNINGDNQPHGDVQFGFLAADADASRLVSRPDQTLVQGQLNQPVTTANFREDLTADGRINNSDLQLIKANKKHSIP